MLIEKIKERLSVQTNLIKKVNKTKREVPIMAPSPDLIQAVKDYAYEKLIEAHTNKDKAQRDENMSKVSKDTLTHFEKTFTEEKLSEKEIQNSLRNVKKQLHELEFFVVRETLFENNLRADQRKPEEIRDISIELDVLPSAHGSAVFTRGQTQALGVVTLGTTTDKQRYDSLEGTKEKNFLLHYNFPAYSTGEVKRNMSPGEKRNRTWQPSF